MLAGKVYKVSILVQQKKGENKWHIKLMKFKESDQPLKKN